MRSGPRRLLAAASLIALLLLACTCVALLAGLVTGTGRTVAQATTNRIIYGLPLLPANLDRITKPTTKSQKALALLGPFDHYHVVDPLTIQIVLKTPYAPLLDGLCQVYTGIASPQALKQYDNLQYQYHQVGSGPYQMV